MHAGQVKAGAVVALICIGLYWLVGFSNDARMGRCAEETGSVSYCRAYFDEMDTRHQYDDVEVH